MNISEKLEQLFSTSFERGLFSGNVLVAKDGKVLYTGIFGLSNYYSEEQLTSNSIFELASVTKPLTAIGIGILVEQGKLNYSDSIEKWLPNFPYPRITLRHALTHTSGLPDYMELFEKHWDYQRIATNTDVLHLLATYRPQPYFNAGEKYQYSNTGYVCLASVIEAAARMPYSTFMQNYVFTPAKMHRTKIMNRRYKPEFIEDFAYGFIRGAENSPLILPDGLPGYEFVKYLDGIQGDGMIHSTIIDLLSLDTKLRSGDLLSASSLDLALSPILTEDGQKTPCGYGWFIDNIPNIGIRISHSGGWPGYSTMLASYLEAGYTVILLSNVENLYAKESMSSWLQQVEQYISESIIRETE
ncbi:serine hydrolase domain-containing protein [Metasolibacillus sp. FSL K6-0083]|uniref:serine hydrolase domain-containing protein n=1 Tax=Metasolibacillus sp. FSL K6-0083 TaxID=2921416 RepID=UPI00315B1340